MICDSQPMVHRHLMRNYAIASNDFSCMTKAQLVMAPVPVKWAVVLVLAPRHYRYHCHWQHAGIASTGDTWWCRRTCESANVHRDMRSAWTAPATMIRLPQSMCCYRTMIQVCGRVDDAPAAAAATGGGHFGRSGAAVASTNSTVCHRSRLRCKRLGTNRITAYASSRQIASLSRDLRPKLCDHSRGMSTDSRRMPSKRKLLATPGADRIWLLQKQKKYTGLIAIYQIQSAICVRFTFWSCTGQIEFRFGTWHMHDRTVDHIAQWAHIQNWCINALRLTHGRANRSAIRFIVAILFLQMEWPSMNSDRRNSPRLNGLP